MALQHLPPSNHAGKEVNRHLLPLPAYLHKGGGGNHQSLTPVGGTGQRLRTGGQVQALMAPGPVHLVHLDRDPEVHDDQGPPPDPPSGKEKGHGQRDGKNKGKALSRGKGHRHGGLICQRCGQLVKGTGHPAGDKASMDAHMQNSSKCLAAAGLRPAKEKCQWCGKLLAHGDRWARQQHSWHCWQRWHQRWMSWATSKGSAQDSIHQELLLKDSEALLVLHLVFHMAFFYLSSTSGDRIQAGTGKKCLKFQGKKADLKVEKADLKQSPLTFTTPSHLNPMMSSKSVAPVLPRHFLELQAVLFHCYRRAMIHSFSFTHLAVYKHVLHVIWINSSISWGLIGSHYKHIYIIYNWSVCTRSISNICCCKSQRFQERSFGRAVCLQ